MEHKWTLQSLEKVFTDLAIQEASAVPSLDTDLSGARHRQSVENATEYRARIVKRQRQTFVQNRVPLGTPPGTDELDMPAEDEDRPDNRSESPRPPHGEVLGQANSMLSLVALANANQLLKRLRMILSYDSVAKPDLRMISGGYTWLMFNSFSSSFATSWPEEVVAEESAAKCQEQESS